MDLKEALVEIYKKAKENYQFENTPKLILRQDEKNAENLFGRTAYYNPSDMSIVLGCCEIHYGRIECGG